LDEWGRDEQELVRRCKEGSEAAYAVLVRLHRPRLYTLAYRLLLDREAAEDVVQETFIAAFRQMERFEPRPSLAAWLNTIALRIATRAAARQRARPKTSIDAPAFRDDAHGTGATDGSADRLGLAAIADTSPGADPHASAEAADLRRAVSTAIGELPFKYRAAVVLRHVMGLDYAEAARELDLPLNTFKSHLLRGTKLLRKGLEAELGSRGAGAAKLEAPGASTTGATMTGVTARRSDGHGQGEAGEAADSREFDEIGEMTPTPERIAGG
jgi:RNA polymerase sigma-70 factor (ECF subfamily)